MQPRWYQRAAVDSVFEYFMREVGNPVVAMPTGTGKSLVFGMFTAEALQAYPQTRVLMLTHVKELIVQDMKALRAVWPNAPAGIFSAGLKKKEANFPIVLGGVASVKNNIEAIGWRDIVWIDEAHLLSPDESTMYQEIIAKLTAINPALKVIGASATPWRMGLGHITTGGIFTHVCYDLTTPEGFHRLISEGFLSPLFPRPTRTRLDTSEVGVSKGEYVQSQLQSAVDKDEITYAALQELVEYGHDRHSWLIFASGIEHTEHIASALAYFGVPACAIHSKLAAGERDARIEGFKAGKYRAAINNNILTTGFDHPPIDLMGILRPTLSTPLWVQMLGRGTRPSPETGKSYCLVLDFAGNTPNLGPIDDPVLPKKKGEGTGDAPVKICDYCGGYNHTRVRFCEQCGAEFIFRPGITGTSGTAELLSGGALPVTEYFEVQNVIYSKHNREDNDKPPTMKVSYRSGMKMFSEYVCFEHNGFPRHRAHEWWKQRSPRDPPETVDLALHYMRELRTPKRIMVWTNKKYPEVMGAEF